MAGGRHLWKEEWVHVEELEGGAPRLVVVAEEEDIAARVHQQLDMVVALDHLVPGVRCLVSGIRCLASGIWCLLSGVWNPVSGIQNLVSRIRCLVSQPTLN